VSLVSAFVLDPFGTNLNPPGDTSSASSDDCPHWYLRGTTDVVLSGQRSRTDINAELSESLGSYGLKWGRRQ